jgi:outer membrane protein TolC
VTIERSKREGTGSSSVSDGPAAQAERGFADRHPLNDFIQTSLERNPAIQSAVADARAKLARIPQATALPDPVVRSIVRPEPIQTAAGDVYFTLGVSQTFPLPAKLERAGEVAAAEVRMAIGQLNAKRLQVIADVQRAYWRIYLFDRYLEITAENIALLEDLEQVVGTQYEVGKAQQQDLLRTQTELARLRDEQHRYELRRATAAATLNRLMDYPTRREIADTTPADVPAIEANVEYLTALAADHNPELEVLQQQIERDREQVELANLGYWPDVNVGFEWNYLEPRDAFQPPRGSRSAGQGMVNRLSESGTDNWALMLRMNLPIWAQRVEAAKREARQRLMATQDELRSTENLVAFRIFDAWSRVEAQQHTLRILDSELIPQARQTYEVTLIDYQAGKASFITLIDNWQRWLDFELMRHRETVDLQTAFAELQQEVGLQLVLEGRGIADSHGQGKAQ